ncbi:MAG TPA: beta-propeller domain-containing protein [Kofleriaceae bacterium]|nr:beta-propeller domain-containing protein [Kofleriaceae bacterium]
MRSYLFGALGLTAVASLLGPASSNAQAPTAIPAIATNPLAMTANKQCDAVRDLVIDTAVHQMIVGYGYGYGYNPYYGGYPGAIADEAMPTAQPSSKAAAAPVAAPAPSAGRAMPVQQSAPTSGPSHYTTTNVHEKGVDEADLVKTDGKYVYTLRNNELIVAKTWPVDKPDVVARLTFKTMVPTQLYLHGEQLVLQGYATQPRQNQYAYGSTRVIVVNAHNRERPKLEKIFDVDGGTFSSRIVGDDMYLVQNGYLQMPPKLLESAQKVMAKIPRADQTSLRPWEIQSRLAATLRKAIYSNLTAQDVEAMLPAIYNGSQKTPLACDSLYMPPNNMQLGLTALARISLTSSKTDLVGAMVSGGTVYASTDSLYIASPFYQWNQQGYSNMQTQVHQFSLADKDGKPRYVASGAVDGNILNEFSMSEYNGDLRIATTDWQWNGQQGGNHLFVMRPRGSKLEVIGAVRGLAKGERIYAGRMFGDRGYLVTFKQTDPLFTLDLSDPQHPRVAGELKINGFSNYIHPMGGNLLLTIGQDADENGRVKGMHLQMFDVNDATNPKRRFHETFALKNGGNYSYSAAQNDHHAFTYDPFTGTLALPFYEYNSNTGTNYQGLIAYHVDAKRGFKSLGRIDHGMLADKMIAHTCEQQKKLNNGNDVYYCNKANWKNMRSQYPIDRSIVVDKYLMTLGTAGLMIHTIAGLDQVSMLSWSKIDDHAALAQ